MARRMFSPKIVGSDAFLDMPISTQALYFHLGMEADDDGFVNPKKIMRIIGASDDDLKVLVGKRFVLPFDNGIVVIKHWRINNQIRKDFHRDTVYLEEKERLIIKTNGAYTETGKQIVNKMLTSRSRRIGKDRIGKDINNAPPVGDIDILLNEKSSINYDFQYLGLEVFEKTGAPENKKSECIRLAKVYPDFINPALSFCLDYPNQALKWKMFLWKLNDLNKNAKISK